MTARPMPAAFASAGERLAAELDRLAASDRPGLERSWQRVFGRPAPAGLSPALLGRALAYRIQAVALGDLDRETARILRQLDKGRNGREGRAGIRDGPDDRRPIAVPLPDVRGRSPGTLLSREWGGRMHAVMVLEEGFAWNGSTFASLSKVAYAITGTKWNGPRFFGLREPTRTRLRPKQESAVVPRAAAP